LFRAKGFVWFNQQRSQRYVFHFSGKQRAECGAEGPWQGPPGVQLVLIGQQEQQLQQLQQGLAGCVAGACVCSTSGADSVTAAQQQAVNELQQQQQQQPLAQSSATDQAEHQAPGCESSNAAAAHFTQLVQQHHRFELVQQEQQQQQLDLQCNSSHAAGLVQFTALASPLHGVVADEVRPPQHRVLRLPCCAADMCCFG
jgi:hypothetical protein